MSMGRTGAKMRQQAARLKGYLERWLSRAKNACQSYGDYCADHRATLSADHSGLPSLRVQVLLASGCVALFVWFLPWLSSAIKASPSAATIVQTFEIHVACRRPALGEQLVIIAGARGEAPHECVYVRSRGAYGRDR